MTNMTKFEEMLFQLGFVTGALGDHDIRAAVIALLKTTEGARTTQYLQLLRSEIDEVLRASGREGTLQ